MPENKPFNPPINIGASLLLVVFLILSLVTFAALSLSSAKSDHNFSSRLADRTEEYYNASNQAEEILDEIDLILEQTSGTGALRREKLLGLSEATSREMGIPLVLAPSDSLPETISYTVPFGDNQALSVILRLTDGTGNGYYEILSWQTVNQEDSEENQPVQLMPVQL